MNEGGRAMANKLGIFCRKLRLERGELLYDMAQKLNVSSAFLSKVENGKKKPPMQWKQIIISEYDLAGNALEEFEECFFEAINADSIDISGYEESDKELMLSFARKFDALDKALIRRMLDNKED